MSNADPGDRSLIARIAAHESWANTTNRSARTAPARAALDRKFLEEAGGDPVRAAHLRSAWYARLALKSAQARRKGRMLAPVGESTGTSASVNTGRGGEPGAAA